MNWKAGANAVLFIGWTGIAIVLAVNHEPGYAAMNGMIAAANLLLFIVNTRA